MIELITMLICGLGMGISISNFMWSKEVWRNNKEWYERLSKLPIEERKTGQWIGGELGKCSVCGHKGVASDIWNGCYDKCYCPNCGAKMEVEHDKG